MSRVDGRRWRWWCGPASPEGFRRAMRDYAAAGLATGLVLVLAQSWPVLRSSAALLVLPVATLLAVGWWCGWRTPSGRIAFAGGFISSLTAIGVGDIFCFLTLDADHALRAATLALVIGTVPLAAGAMVCGAIGAAVRQAIDPKQLVFSADECPQCGYSFHGLVGPQCPECGAMDPLRMLGAAGPVPVQAPAESPASGAPSRSTSGSRSSVL